MIRITYTYHDQSSCRRRAGDADSTAAGQPIQQVGLAVTSRARRADGSLYLDYLRWDGAPDLRLRRPSEPGDFWRRAWVNNVSVFSRRFPPAFHISQDRGDGMIIHGTRQWRDYRVTSAVTIRLARRAGLAVRVQGLRRFYALLLCRDGAARLVKMRDDRETVLAEAAFDWAFERCYRLSLEAIGDTLVASIDGRRVLDAVDAGEDRLADGGIALLIAEGAMSTEAVAVTPP